MKILRIVILTLFLCPNLYCQLSLEWSKVYEEQNFFDPFKRITLVGDSIFTITNEWGENTSLELLSDNGNIVFNTEIINSDTISTGNIIIPFFKQEGLSIITQSYSFDDNEIIILNYDNNGEYLGVTFEQETFYFTAIRQFERDEAGNIYIATNDNWPNLAVSKFDKNLNYLWTNSTIAEGEITDDVTISRLVIDEQNNSYLAFDTEVEDDRLIAVNKINSDGGLLWRYQYNHFHTLNFHTEEVLNSEMDSEGNLIVSVAVKISDKRVLVVVKLDANTGQVIWVYEHEEPMVNNSYLTYQTSLNSHGQVICSFRKESLEPNAPDIQTKHLILINEQGELEWEITLEPNLVESNFTFVENTSFNAVYCKANANCRNIYFDTDQDDHIYVVGSSGNNQVAILRIDKDGNILGMDEFQVPNTTAYENKEILIAKDKIYLFGFDDDANSIHLTQLRQEWETGLTVPPSKVLSISPNPFTHKLNLQTTALIKNLNIYTTTGQLIHSEKNISGSDCSMNTAEWQSGVYFVMVELADGKVLREKVVKL